MTVALPHRTVGDPQATQNFERLRGQVLTSAEINAKFTLQAAIASLAFVNNWRWYVGGNNSWEGGYYKDPVGIVHLEGLVDKAANGTAGNFIAHETIFTLPVGYRPWRSQIHVAEMAGGSGAYGAGQIRIDNGTGNVMIGDRGAPANPVAWVSLNGISFRAA